MRDFKECYSELRKAVIRELGAIADLCNETPAMLVPYKGGINNGKDIMVNGIPDWLAVYQSIREDKDMQALVENARE